MIKAKYYEYHIYFLIGVLVALFNLIAVFGPKFLLHDDPGLYRLIINGEFHGFASWMSRYDLICPFLEWIVCDIMAYSPPLARGLHVMFLMIPLSCCFYYLYHFKFGFPRKTAITAAVLPTILPMQWQIPAGINMSYLLWGLLFSIFSLIIGFHYLEKNTPKNWFRLASAILCYLIATQIMELALFFLPPLVLAFWGYGKITKKHFFLILAVTLVGISKFVHMVMLPRKESQMMPIDIILKRIGLYFQWALPVPDILPAIAVIIFLGIISIGFILYFNHPIYELKPYCVFSRFPSKIKNSLLYGFFIIWAISNIFPIILLSIPFPPRYSYISMFGAQAIFVFSIYVILKKIFPGKRKIYTLFFIGIILLSGVFRIIFLKNTFAPENQIKSIIMKDLNRIPLPLNSQVVIVNLKGFYGGWPRSSGYFQFTLKRNDIIGLAGPVNSSEYYNFDNHFDPMVRGWYPRHQMTGLSLERPLFLFYFDEENRKLDQLEYVLQWRGAKRDAPWTIFKVDKIMGEIFPLAVGIGMEEYVSVLQKLKERGISQKEILWGGPPTKAEQRRLEKGT
ncbi:MAG TPA: hypothetical protein VK469_00495 [Candidatus Kapabacteria bacterium]|nr:hypothetical protein [Candidatus Kapabacteria bacterium]